MSRTTTGTYGTMYYVHDMKKSAAFYRAALGTEPRYESESWTEFDVGDGTALCLHSIDGKAPLSQGGIHIVNTTDIRAKVAALKAAGVEFVRDVAEVHPGAYSAHSKDPSGNVVSFYEQTS